MTEIDFYILASDTPAARDHFACRLAEKALRVGRHIVLCVDNEDHAQSLSDYLWSFKPESFIPHQLSNQINKDKPKDATKEAANVIIDWQNNIHHYHDVLINLTATIPNEFSRFQKLSEIVIQDKDLLATTRKHFQFYRDRGYPLKTYDMK